ncbi:MAG: helix-turn-helix transcriptional regulator [Alphaproteobacteria bacterium]
MEPEPIYREIGGIIRAQRRLRDKAQSALAGQLGISRATLANIETGRQRILVHQLYAIAKALNVKLSDLLPLPRDEDVDVNWATLPIEGDLNEEQRKQIASLIGPIGEQLPASKKAKGRDAKTQRNTGRSSARTAR